MSQRMLQLTSVGSGSLPIVISSIFQNIRGLSFFNLRKENILGKKTTFKGECWQHTKNKLHAFWLL